MGLFSVTVSGTKMLNRIFSASTAWAKRKKIWSFPCGKAGNLESTVHVNGWTNRSIAEQLCWTAQWAVKRRKQNQVLFSREFWFMNVAKPVFTQAGWLALWNQSHCHRCNKSQTQIIWPWMSHDIFSQNAYFQTNLKKKKKQTNLQLTTPRSHLCQCCEPGDIVCEPTDTVLRYFWGKKWQQTGKKHKIEKKKHPSNPKSPARRCQNVLPQQGSPAYLTSVKSASRFHCAKKLDFVLSTENDNKTDHEAKPYHSPCLKREKFSAEKSKWPTWTSAGSNLLCWFGLALPRCPPAASGGLEMPSAPTDVQMARGSMAKTWASHCCGQSSIPVARRCQNTLILSSTKVVTGLNSHSRARKTPWVPSRMRCPVPRN